jgi:hypothetical protein
MQAKIPAEARTASLLGTEHDGSGVVIDDAGLIVPIGYLITEAMVARPAARRSSVSIRSRGWVSCARSSRWR